MLNWTATREDFEIIVKIAERYIQLVSEMNIKVDKMILIMDIQATHDNGCPLKLDELLKADDGNFAHDVTGIRVNINRQTGKLENCFLPRFAQ